MNNVEPKKIILVDDEEIICRAIVRLLRTENYEIDCFQDGVEALEAFNATYDLLICDSKIPGKKGIEIVEEVRKVNPHIKIVVMTGYADQDHIDAFEAFDINLLLIKPFDSIQFKTQLRDLLFLS
jgi:two-component system, response regulator YesN